MSKTVTIAEPGEILDPAQKPLTPKDAATLVILDRTGTEPRVLMGKRRADLAFMAGKYVFPGGRVDVEDKAVPVAGDLRPAEIAKLMAQMRGRASAVRARALALAAVREAFEEAGLIIGAKATGVVAPAANWTAFFERGFKPTLAPLTFFARAITPPGRPRRFDTRFFCMDANAISERLKHNDGELSGLDWLTLDAARELDIPRITRLVLEDLTEQLDDGSLDAGTNPVPFYYSKNASFKRDLITAEG
jgi:8-oxo-dGTP pyrophosphatase MutT (NUDIX family)